VGKQPPERLTAMIDELCRTVPGAVAIERAVATHLHAAVGFDAWCALTLDPATVLPTGGYHERGVPQQRLPRLVEIEARGEDALSLPTMAHSRNRVCTLSQATRGHLASSQRYREILAPSGLEHELRALFPTESGVWGALVLFRRAGSPDFSPGETGLIKRATRGVASAIRREMVLTEIDQSHAGDCPGLLLLDESLNPVSVTSSAEGWLAQIEDGVDVSRGLPYAVATVAHRALADRAGPVRARIRTRTGRWLTLHAERLAHHSGHLSLIIQPARPIEIAELIVDAYGLTGRERTVVRLMTIGHSRSEIARMLSVSNHTIDDHVKRIFGKLQVRSRAELTAKLFFDQHAPRIAQEVPVGGTGWFLR
jgi:DNA-binding CsgD family transcriptional regulator